MVFKCFKWRPSFKTYERGVRKGDLTYERPRPFFDLRKKAEWIKFLVYLFGGFILAGLCGIFAYFLVATAVGGFVATCPFWVYLFGGLWILFCVIHLVHSLRFIKIADLTNVDFIPIEKAKYLGRRLLTMPEDFTQADYYILYSRYIWADVECEPYRDVTDWVERMQGAYAGGRAVSVGGGKGAAESIAEGIGYSIGEKYAESKLKEIEEIAGGIPEPREIVKILQTELVPKFRKLLGEELMRLYLIFLGTQPPVLPFDKSTSRGEMRAVADASDTKEVLDYLSKFAKKPRRKRKPGWTQLVSRKPSEVTTDETVDDYESPTAVISQWRNNRTGELCRIRKVKDVAVGTAEEIDSGEAPVYPVGYVAEAQMFSLAKKRKDIFFIIKAGQDTSYRRIEKRTKEWMREYWL